MLDGWYGKIGAGHSTKSLLMSHYAMLTNSIPCIRCNKKIKSSVITTIRVYLIFCCFGGIVQLSAEPQEKVFTNGWAVKIEGANHEERVKRVAEKYGFDKISKIGTLDGYYHLEHPHHPVRSKRSLESQTSVLRLDDEIIWAEQQHEYVREKRGVHHNRITTRGIQPRFADPLWDEQWYLDDKRTSMDLDINVIPVWNAGLSGKGVVVTILDDGIEHNHTDLAKNYDPAASWDVNDNDPDPLPRYDYTNENKHGTRCAGEVAAQANNSVCGVGVAYNARIGGVRMLDGRVTDRVEAESLSLNPQYIDIYSASWGPSDDGMTVEGPGTLASAAFLNGITKGRGGLGSIYVWASGNGGRHDDSCNCDGYTASIYTLSISSSSDHGESPWYSEACASTLATTLSSGAHGEKRIVTTDLHNQCTERHTGTSASAPLAAGLIALALEKNTRLSWRDVQHLVAHTANWIPLKNDPDWRMNGIGLHVNEKFGFGLLDAEKMVKLADPATFQSVPPKRECQGKVFNSMKTLQWDQPLQLEIDSNGCSGNHNEIRYLEQVQLVLSIDYTRRGDLTIFLTSPMGTRSCLLPVRSEDSSDEGFRKWPFMTTHTWGEDPRGKWILEIKDGGESRRNTGFLKDWRLVLHGTKTKPHHQNITHPEIPIHKKAVPDDIKRIEKSPVQITQITYSFGNSPSPSQSYASHTNELSYNQPKPQVEVSQNTPSVYQPANITPDTDTNRPLNFAQPQSYPFVDTSNKYDSFASSRTNVPLYPNNNYPGYGTQQLPVATNTGYEQNAIVRSAYQQPAYDTNSNLWDFFGRLNGRRSANEEDFYVDEWGDNNSFVRLLQRLEKLDKGYD